MATGIKSTLVGLTAGNGKLFSFFFKYWREPFRALPPALYDDGVMQAQLTEAKPFELQVDRQYVDGYEGDLADLMKELTPLKGNPMTPQQKQMVFWIIRLSCIALAFYGNVQLTFLCTLLQFLFLPYSLFVAIGYGLETVYVLYTGHMLVFPALTLLCSAVLPEALNPTLTISPAFLFGFILIDQLICVKCLWSTPKGKTAPVSTSTQQQSEPVLASQSVRASECVCICECV